MAWNDPNETIIAGTGEAYVAPVGTAQPANESSALNSAFNGLGYHTEDGASINLSPEIVSHRVWQSKHEIRRERESEDFQVTFALVQWNEVNVPLAFGGGLVSDLGGGKYKYTPPDADDALETKALILDLVDGADKLRLVIPKGSVVEGVESQFTRSQMSALPVTFKALEPDDGSPPWYFLTNVTDFAAGS